MKTVKGFYFDYQIFGGERLSAEERRLRERLQRNKTALETIAELGERRGLRHADAEPRRPAFNS